MRHSAGLAVAAALLALGACGGEEEGAGGVTQEESRELDEAAEMLDASPDSLADGEGAELGNGDAGAEIGELPVVDEAATREAQ